MQEKLSGVTFQINESTLYATEKNNVYLVTDPDSRNLLCRQEIVGYQIPQLLLQATTNSLTFFSKNHLLGDVNVVNILRGGLNFPVEAACFQSGINVYGVSYLGSERIFLNESVSRIESKYRKINLIDEASVVIGDIIASGETLKSAVKYIEEEYVQHGKKLRNIVVFTIGTHNALKTIAELNTMLKKQWPSFSGVWVVFFEGIFNTYPNKGISGLNLPNVDFYINGALLSPEYRYSLMSNNHIIFEKCTIYDGGARRFEQIDHISTILNYWSSLTDKSGKIKIEDFWKEKYGYKGLIEYEEWVRVNHYEFLVGNKLEKLYQNEQDFFTVISSLPLSQIAEARLLELNNYYSDFR